jgi:hypothetical protein
MLSFCKTLHVLAVALWFGAVAFFSVAGVLIFSAFTEESRKQANERELWFPLPTAFQHESPAAGFPEPLRLEQGSRAAGVAVGAVFPVFYALQTGCAIIVVLTALWMARRGSSTGRLHRWRLGLCVLALCSVSLGWWLERVVHDLRKPRNERTDAVLLASAATPQQVEEARVARATFARWHGYSLMQNFATLALVAVITALTAHLPAHGSATGGTEKSGFS